MKRFDIINYLIKKHNYRSYLEIGVLGNDTFNNLLPLNIKHGIDPNGYGTHNMTSDIFFSSHCKQSYDIIFVDGLHLHEQVLKDVENGLTHLNDRGTIIVHDCLPEYEWHQLETPVSGKPWTGTVWKAFADLRASRTDIKMYTINSDWGCGVIQRGSQELINKPADGWTWEYFLKHKKDIMNIITVEEFIRG